MSTAQKARALAHSQLLAEIADMLDGGEVIPCLSLERGSLWISDDAEDQQAAAHGCRRCPAMAACERYVIAFPEPEGVWAGRHGKRVIETSQTVTS